MLLLCVVKLQPGLVLFCILDANVTLLIYSLKVIKLFRDGGFEMCVIDITWRFTSANEEEMSTLYFQN